MTTRSKLGIALLALGISLSAMAMDLGQAMSALAAQGPGLVGEQADGYLGVVSNSGQAADIAAQTRGAPNTRRWPTAAALRWPTWRPWPARRRWRKPLPGSTSRSAAGEEIARRLRERSGTLLRSQGPGSVRGIFPVVSGSFRTPAVFHGFCDRLSRKAAPGLSSII